MKRSFPVGMDQVVEIRCPSGMDWRVVQESINFLEDGMRVVSFHFPSSHAFDISNRSASSPLLWITITRSPPVARIHTSNILTLLRTAPARSRPNNPLRVIENQAEPATLGGHTDRPDFGGRWLDAAKYGRRANSGVKSRSRSAI